MTTATAGALTAVIGYIGSEVAEEFLLERLLWPQRFNNEMTFQILLQQALLMTAGGPLHKAALKALETLRIQGIFSGPCRGHMLGTIFFSEHKIMHFRRCSPEQMLIPEKSRNAFWVRVLHSVRADRRLSFDVPRQDSESRPLSDAYRSLQPVHHLKLGVVRGDQKPAPNEVWVSEDGTSITVVVSCMLSELTSVLSSLIALFGFKDVLFFVYLLIPSFLKLLLVIFSVRRVKLMSQKSLQEVALKENTDVSVTEGFEVADPIHKFMVIEGPQPVVVQFFRHYGHPMRDQNSLWIGDRVREIACMAILCCLFLYFPVGLIISQWAAQNVQYLWFGYQLYAVIVMHVVRLLGWHDLGRTEKRIAKLLSNGKTVWLKTETGCTVSACLVLHGVDTTAEGKDKVQEIMNQCKERLAERGKPTPQVPRSGPGYIEKTRERQTTAISNSTQHPNDKRQELSPSTTAAELA